MNETYSAWVRGRLPKYDKPHVEWIENLNPSVVIDAEKTYDEGCFLLPAFGPDKYYWKVYRRPE